MPVPSERTPTTATEEGRSIGASERASARNSRASARAVDSSSRPVPSVSTTVPMSKSRWLAKPASEKTCEHRVVLGKHVGLEAT